MVCTNWRSYSLSRASKYLHCLDDLQVGHLLYLRVLWGIEILFGPQNALLEQVLVDELPILLGNQHPRGTTAANGKVDA